MGFTALTATLRIRGGSAGPILRQPSVEDESVEGRVGPIDHARGEAMLHGIEMDVVDAVL